MEHFERKSNIVGLLILLLVFTVIGIISSYLYVALSGIIGEIYVNAALAVGFGAILFGTVQIARHWLKITTTLGTCVVVVIGLVIIHYFNWTFYFVWALAGTHPFREIGLFWQDVWVFLRYSDVSDFIYFLRFLNYQGWMVTGFDFIGDIDVRGPLLWVVWFLEFAIITAFPIVGAYLNDGVFLHSHKQWATPRHMPYPFAPFDEEERERIASGDTDVILNKPLTETGDFSTVSVCYAGEEPTEYIAIFKSSLTNDGKINHGSPSNAIRLTLEKIEELEKQLAIRHPEKDENEDDYQDNEDNETPPEDDYLPEDYPLEDE